VETDGLAITEATTMTDLPTKTTRAGLALDAKASSQSSQLIYRRSAFKQGSTGVIRSAKTAELLQLNPEQSEVDSSPSNRFRQPVQPGGVIRSRLTAELLGITPGGFKS
jgi:hypothetical protein|tara:strand:- start:51 stop:377 length:327 start_codon:yes stop_codon:yes gene_type:complete